MAPSRNGKLKYLLICAVLIGGYFFTERNLQQIDIPSSVHIPRDGAGGYAFSLDVDRMLYSEHLIDPPESEPSSPSCHIGSSRIQSTVPSQ